MASEASPSNCTYCYSLECSLWIGPANTSTKMGTITAKQATVTVGRNNNRDILLQVELKSSRGALPAVSSYSLAECEIHSQAAAQGKGCIAIPSRNLLIQMSNCPPRQINVFLKSLAAKLEIMKAEKGGDNLKTPMAVIRKNLLQGLPNVFNALSPLTVGEIRKVRRLRGVATGQSPHAKVAKSPKTPSAGPKRPLREIQTTTPTTSKAVAPGLSRIPSTKVPERIQLTEEQRKVVRAVIHQKKNVFFTGSAGTGKSLVLRRIIEMLPASTAYITAATGVAACQLGGITLHSFANIGVGGISNEQCLQIAAAKKNAVKQWKECTHLIIDEISMVEPNFFDAMEYVARCLRNSDEPFGGIQVIITGDFLQLPPVVKKEEDLKFCFEAASWPRVIQKTILLTDVKRQDDQVFVKLLQNIRLGRCDSSTTAILQAARTTDFNKMNVIPTRLCTHTADAEKINQISLNKLETEERRYSTEDSQYIPENAICLAPKLVILKIGAQVMLNKNLDLSRGLSNGSRGVITSFSKLGFPMVQFLANSEKELEVKPCNFMVRIAGSEEPAVRKQIPLQLAWAISIHKSQGLTLDCVEINLSKVFAEGQAYVALSRARNLNSIRVLGFDSTVIRANKRVIRYYESLQENIEEEDDGLRDKNDREFCLHKLPSPNRFFVYKIFGGSYKANRKKCHDLVDKYVEYDVTLTVVDLIMHYSHAYRHIIYNMPGKNILRLFILFIFCDAYDKWITERANGMEENKIYDLELIFYKSLARSSAEFIAYLFIILLFEVGLRQTMKRTRFVLESSILGNVAVLLSIIFKLSNEPFYQIATKLFLWISHIQVQRALFPEMHLITNVAVVTAACTASLVVGRSMHELLPIL